MKMPDGQFVMTYDSARAADNEMLGPVTPRGGHSGIVYRGGKVLAEWGDTNRADMTFSVAKSFLSLLAGLAVASPTDQSPAAAPAGGIRSAADAPALPKPASAVAPEGRVRRFRQRTRDRPSRASRRRRVWGE